MAELQQEVTVRVRFELPGERERAFCEEFANLLHHIYPTLKPENDADLVTELLGRYNGWRAQEEGAADER